MALRPGRCYRKLQRPFTRQSIKVPKKGYIKGVPRPKISEYEQGKKGKYDKTLFLISKQSVQIRHNALESARVSTVQTLEKNIGRGSSYFLKIRVFPHHVIRENPLATGAGADRFQQGMRMSFGKPIGIAARVKQGQRIMEIRVNENDVNAAKKALKQASYKLPAICRIVVEDMKK